MFINSCIALFINGVYLAFINTPDIEHVIPAVYTAALVAVGWAGVENLKK